MIVASFWVYRPEEHPNAADYPAMLRILDKSCKRLGLAHIVLTDRATFDSPKWPDDIAACAYEGIPKPLMNAATECQARFVEGMASSMPRAVALVGADCIMKKVPTFADETADFFVTYRDSASRYPINTGLQFVPAGRAAAVAPLFRRVAARCGQKWCADQRALIEELSPMPRNHGTHERAGLRVGFLPMKPYNVRPASPADTCPDAIMLHFRGKAMKGLMFDWAERNGYA